MQMGHRRNRDEVAVEREGSEAFSEAAAEISGDEYSARSSRTERLCSV